MNLKIKHFKNFEYILEHPGNTEIHGTAQCGLNPTGPYVVTRGCKDVLME